MSNKAGRAIEVIPFEIHNLEPFLGDSEYPEYHPLSYQYGEYWDKKTEEVILGIWGEDAKTRYDGKRIGGYRWLPGNIAFHTQHCVIDKEVPGMTTKKLERPDLRDVEWFIGYDMAACEGFSGFENDDKRSAFRPLGKLQRGEHLTNAEKILLDKYKDTLVDKYGRWKTYVEARELLYQTFDEPLGNPLWLNEASNYMLLSSRRLGKSYLFVNGKIVYDFCFNGAKTLEDLWAQKTRSNSIVGSGNSDKTKEFFNKFNVTYNHIKNNVGAYRDHLMNENGAWWWKYSGSVKKENEFIINSTPSDFGSGMVGPGSQLWHMSYQKSASKGAGQSQTFSLVEEVGLTEGVEDIHAENQPAQKGDYKFGWSAYIGTGGDFKKIMGSKKMFYNPGIYNILPCKDHFTLGGADTARFIPAPYYINEFRNEHGNQDVQKAWEDIVHERQILEDGDTRQYLRHKASYPLSPKEIFVKFDSNRFPVKNLEDRVEELRTGVLPHSTGKIAFHDKLNLDAYWIEDFDEVPLMHMDDLMDDNSNKEGAMVQYESPSIHRPDRVPNDTEPMYQLFLEPVRNDAGSSSVYAYVWKFYDFAEPNSIQDNIVFEWFGRLSRDDENLARIFDIASYYGCNIYPEINNDAVVGYARRIGRLDWLVRDLGYIEGLEVNNTNKSGYGFYVSPGMKKPLERLLNEWLREEVYFQEEIIDDHKVKKSTVRANVLNSSIACSQLISYDSDDGNFDAVDGLRLKALWDKATQGVDEQFQDKRGMDRLKSLVSQHNRQRFYGVGRRLTQKQR